MPDEPKSHKVHHCDEAVDLVRRFQMEDGETIIALAAQKVFVTSCKEEGRFCLFMEASMGGPTLYLQGRRKELDELIATLQLARDATAPKPEPEVQRKREG